MPSTVGDFPFLIVSLANYNPVQTKPVEPEWAELRESQWRTAQKVPNTGLAVTIDIGDANDIHPRNKQEVGRRLGLVARRLVYGEKDLVASGPEFDEMMIANVGKWFGATAAEGWQSHTWTVTNACFSKMWGYVMTLRPEQSVPFVIGKVEVSTEPFK